MGLLDDIFGNVASFFTPKVLQNKPFQGVTGAQGQGVTAPQFQGLTNPQFQGLTAPQFQGLQPSVSHEAPSPSAFLQGLQNPQSADFGPIQYSPGMPYQTAPGFDPNTANPPQETPLPSFQDALAQAKSLLSGSGWNPGYIDVNSISYDPLRNAAKGRAAESDAKVAAMYKQLQGSVRGQDAKDIAANTAATGKDVKATNDSAVQQIQQAAAAAQAHNDAVMKNLGLGDAQVRQIQQGSDAASATAQNVADAVARGQAATNAVSQKGQASKDYNTQMAGAYGLQGGETQDALKQQLAQILSQYDMQEQQARNAATDKNSALRQNEQSTQFNLANQILGNQWNTIKYNDSIAQAQYAAQQQAQQQALQQQAAAQQQAQAQDYWKQMVAANPNANVSPFLPFLLGRAK